MRQIGVMLLLLLGVAHAWAATEPLYVSDRQVVPLYQEPDTKGLVIALVPSGENLEPLQQRGPFTQVKTAQGEMGWIKSSRLVIDKPAQVRVTELIQSQIEITTQVKQLQGKIQSVVNKPASTDKSGRSLTFYRWLLLGVLALVLVLGFVGGSLWFDYRQRQRHGGFRV